MSQDTKRLKLETVEDVRCYLNVFYVHYVSCAIVTYEDASHFGSFRSVSELPMDDLADWSLQHGKLPKDSVCRSYWRFLVVWHASAESWNAAKKCQHTRNVRKLNDTATENVMCKPDSMFIQEKMMCKSTQYISACRQWRRQHTDNPFIIWPCSTAWAYLSFPSVGKTNSSSLTRGTEHIDLTMSLVSQWYCRWWPNCMRP